MKTEADYKRIIKASMEVQGGQGYLLEGLYQKGIPDMFLSHPRAWPCLAEVKLERNCKVNFKRRLKYSKLQEDNLRKLHSSNPSAALGLCVVEIEGEVMLVALDPREEFITHAECHSYVWLNDKYFDMGLLFDKYRLTKDDRAMITEST